MVVVSWSISMTDLQNRKVPNKIKFKDRNDPMDIEGRAPPIIGTYVTVLYCYHGREWKAIQYMHEKRPALKQQVHSCTSDFLFLFYPIDQSLLIDGMAPDYCNYALSHSCLPVSLSVCLSVIDIDRDGVQSLDPLSFC